MDHLIEFIGIDSIEEFELLLFIGILQIWYYMKNQMESQLLLENSLKSDYMNHSKTCARLIRI